jgi:hypothetical protein
MFQITEKGRAYIDVPRAGCAAWVRADAIANYERFQRRFANVARQPLPPA